MSLAKDLVGNKCLMIDYFGSIKKKKTKKKKKLSHLVGGRILR